MYTYIYTLYMYAQTHKLDYSIVLIHTYAYIAYMYSSMCVLYKGTRAYNMYICTDIHTIYIITYIRTHVHMYVQYIQYIRFMTSSTYSSCSTSHTPSIHTCINTCIHTYMHIYMYNA